MDYFPKIFKGLFFLSLGALLFLLWQKNPYQDLESQRIAWPTVVFLNSAFFLFLWGLFFCVIFWFKTRLLTRRGKNSQVKKVSRHSFWLALMLTIFLVLQQARALFWWDGLLVVVALMLVEMFFLSFEEKEDERLL